MKYYKVLIKFGHVGRNKYIDKWCYIPASSKKEAAAKGRLIPRVKHHHKDAIRTVEEIDRDTFFDGREKSRSDLYFQVNNSTDQRRNGCVDWQDIQKETVKHQYKRKECKEKKLLLERILVREDRKVMKGDLYE